MQPLHTLDTDLIPIDVLGANPSLAFARSFERVQHHGPSLQIVDEDGQTMSLGTCAAVRLIIDTVRFFSSAPFYKAVKISSTQQQRYY
jgi:hypothetical protein